MIADTVVTPRSNPDLDGIASAVAYAYFLNALYGHKKHLVGFSGEPQYEAMYVLDRLGLRHIYRRMEKIDHAEIANYSKSTMKAEDNS